MSDSGEYTDGEVYEPNPTERGKWISALVALIGLWLVVEAFVFELAAAQVWNDVLVGALLLVLGGYNFYRRSDEELGSAAAAAIAGLLGAWLVLSPFIFGVEAGLTETVNEAAFWNDVILGLIVLVLGAYSAYEIRDNRREAEAVTT